MRRFLLVSDIHACAVDPTSSNAPSYVSNVEIPGAPNPFADLERLIQVEGLSFDSILCPGDITNKSDPAPLVYAWERINGIAQRYGARLIATVGNHDVDSRYTANKFDPRGYVRTLSPSIPNGDRSSHLEYWAENFTIIRSADCLVVTVNTTAYHGGGKEAAAEIEHGRISEFTIAAIDKAISALPGTAVNIVLCHHHPLRGESEELDVAQVTRGGEKLVEALGASTRPWIVVHGHKHVPDLFYGHGGGNSPVIVACASFSAQVNTDAKNKSPNQVHLLTCDPEGARTDGLSSAGSVRSWTWEPGHGWRRSQGMYGLPHEVGFGYRGDIAVLVDRIDQHLTASGANQTRWSTAVGAIPSLARLIPEDFKRFLKAMEQRNLTLLHDRDGSIAQVGRSS